MRIKNHFGVIGLGFGDEGKGITTDYLAAKHPDALVIRFSGGHQAGHTVQIGDTRHVFSNFGSGTLRGNATYISQFCTVDPEGMMKEFQLLSAKGVENIDIFIDAKTPVTTPYEKWHNHKEHDVLGHGTCGVGVGQTWQREQDHYHLNFGDLFNTQILNIKLENIRKHYYKFKPEPLNEFLFAVEAMKQVAMLIYGIPQGVEKFIFEGSQGLMLDQDLGFFPNVTRSNTGSKNILQMVGGFEPYLITRCYETRHGNGDMTGIVFPDGTLLEPANETNVYNEYQGQFRKRMLNVDTLKYAMIGDGYVWEAENTLVITCLDHFRDCYYYCQNDGTVHTCPDKESFVTEIAEYLGVNKVLISDSPESNNIREMFF